MNRSERKRWSQRHEQRRHRVEVGRVKLDAPGERREAQLRVYRHRDALLAVVDNEAAMPCGVVFAPWPWPQIDRSKAPVFGARGFTPEATAYLTTAMTAPAERAERIHFQDAYRWSRVPSELAGDIFGVAFDRLVVCDALAALAASGVQKEGELRAELLELSTGPAVRFTQWLASAVVLACPGAPTDGDPMPLELS